MKIQHIKRKIVQILEANLWAKRLMRFIVGSLFVGALVKSLLGILGIGQIFLCCLISCVIILFVCFLSSLPLSAFVCYSVLLPLHGYSRVHHGPFGKFCRRLFSAEDYNWFDLISASQEWNRIRGTVDRSIFIKTFSNGAEIFDWIRKEGYLKQLSKSQWQPIDIVTDKMNHKLKKKYSNEFDQILGLFDRCRENQKYGIHELNGIYSTDRNPLVIRREHVNSHLWKDRTFSIVLLFNNLQLTTSNNTTVLKVDLRDQSCAIYSNLGKKFIFQKYISNVKTNYFLTLSKKIHEFLLTGGKEMVVQMQDAPLRWVSGGFLPIVDWKGKKWVCLFFRDIHPIGWNIANGGSETKEEYKNLDKMIFREAREELVICDSPPRRGMQVVHRLFSAGEFQESNSQLIIKMAQEHQRLRTDHDGIHFTIEPQGPRLNDLETSFKVEVTFHEAGETREQTTKDVLIIINPLELGIEIVRVGEFKLQNHQCLLDGEICPSEDDKYLVRQPVGLFDVGWLKQEFERNSGMLGKPETNDRRVLEDIPAECFHVFPEEFYLRKVRLENLEGKGKGQNHEAKRLKNWEKEMSPKFSALLGEGKALTDPQLKVFLPAAWKSIELAIKEKKI